MGLSRSGRWTLAVLVVVVALIVAIWPRGADAPGPEAAGPATRPGTSAGPDEVASDALRESAALDACPSVPDPAPADTGALGGIVVDCLAGGPPIDLGAALHGTPALVNLWAWWCAPCAEEMPLLQEVSDAAGDRLTVITVHTDPKTGNALEKAADYDVHLPGVQDSAGRVRGATDAPPVLPVSVLVRADGTIAKVLPQPFRSTDEIAAAVREYLGVTW